jgi:DnaJ-class molecular chaperone
VTADDAPTESAERTGSSESRECMACRGTGRVISNLGGSPSQVDCPWCEGTGRWRPGVDAQARWRDDGGSQQGSAAP